MIMKKSAFEDSSVWKTYPEFLDGYTI